VTVGEGAQVNGGMTNMIAIYETTATSVTPTNDLLDNQAGQAYYWVVQPCTDNGCGVANASAAAEFVKRSTPVAITSPLGGQTVQNYSVVLSWRDWQTTAGAAISARGYHVQVSTSCNFSSTLDDAITDFPEYVNTNVQYPNGTYYWRVQAVDENASPLTWSTPNRDSNCANVPSFTLHKSVAGAGNPANPSATSSAASAAPVLLDTTNHSVTKAGLWVKARAAKAVGGTTLITDGKKHQRVNLVFTGTTVTVGYCTGPSDGWFTLYIDNKAVKQYNAYRSYTTCGSTITVKNLRSGVKHSVTVTALGKKGTSRRGGSTKVAVDYLQYR
jgi:hypothetical protein